MNVPRVPSPSRPEEKSQAYLWWICIRTLLLFIIALLPFLAVGIALLLGLRERVPVNSGPPAAEAAPDIAEAAIPD